MLSFYPFRSQMAKVEQRNCLKSLISYKPFQKLSGSPTLTLMRTTELTDEQWKHLEPLLPPPHKGKGRPRADDRKTLNGILFVLRTGCRWQDVPREYGSPSTCWRRLRAWEDDGTWERIWRKLLALLDEQGKLRWAKAFLDGSFVAAKKGKPG
jgi:transposase